MRDRQAMDHENQSPQTVRNRHGCKNRYDWFECDARAFASQFVHEEHDEDVHGKWVFLTHTDVRTLWAFS